MTSACHLSDDLLSAFSSFLAERLGLSFPRERWDDLRRGLSGVCGELGFPDAASCARNLLSASLSQRQVELLAGYLTIGETYFFRDKKSFELIETRVLPDLVTKGLGNGRSLRLWSAGCATGEEAYSLAVLVHKLLPDIANWQITILATDINPRFLQKGAAGIYTNWSFREAPAWLKSRYFSSCGEGQWEIAPELRRLVTFSYINLAEDSYPSLGNNTTAMDLILCRNVLMYFIPKTAAGVCNKLLLCLADGGWLNLGAYDVMRSEPLNLPPPVFRGATFYRRSKRAEQSPNRRTPMPERTRVPPEPVLRSWPDAITPHEPPGAPEPVPASSIQECLTLFQQGRYAETARLLFSRLGQQPVDVPAVELLARALANQGRLGDALRWCDRAIALKPLEPRLHFLRGTIQQEQGQLDSAAGSLKTALYLDPNFVMGHFTLGNLFHHEGQTTEALRHFEQARSLLARFPDTERVPESEGLTAGRLRRIIESTMESEPTL